MMPPLHLWASTYGTPNRVHTGKSNGILNVQNLTLPPPHPLSYQDCRVRGVEADVVHTQSRPSSAGTNYALRRPRSVRRARRELTAPYEQGGANECDMRIKLAHINQSDNPLFTVEK